MSEQKTLKPIHTKTNEITGKMKRAGKSERSMAPITRDDLTNLRKLALKEHEDFFYRNPHLRSSYYDSLIGILPCQGAACHYLNLTTGVKDYDIWHFYVKNVDMYFPYRKHKRIENGYGGKPIDFLKRAISKGIFDTFQGQPEPTIMEYMFERNTKTKRKLLKKAMIGLHPDAIFAKVLWKGLR
jgi:hypothetical protein